MPTGDVSVSPQPWQMWRPVSAFQRFETAPCTAMPPPSAIFNELKSSRSKPGVFSSVLNSVLTPVMNVKRTFDISSTKAGMSRGFVIRTFWPPTYVNTRQFVVRAKMWYSGSAVMTTASAPICFSSGIQFTICNVFAIRLRCVSTAPFETPVVPPVYCRKATSCGASSTGRRVSAAPALNASLKCTAPGSVQSGTRRFTYRMTRLTMGPFGKPSWSPMPVTTTLRTGVRSMTCCSTAQAMSQTTMVVAPESLSWCSSSRAVYMGFTLTTIRPARIAPKIAIGYCSRLGIMIATRSPLRRPASACSHAPKRRDSSSISA